MITNNIFLGPWIKYVMGLEYLASVLYSNWCKSTDSRAIFNDMVRIRRELDLMYKGNDTSLIKINTGVLIFWYCYFNLYIIVR